LIEGLVIFIVIVAFLFGGIPLLAWLMRRR
jgi:glycerol-3-phosphate acyltransferase PlsY